MNTNPNIFSAIVFDLHPRVREFLDSLDRSGQIDRDEFNAPHITSFENPGTSLHRIIFIRNGKPENFLLHTRKRVDPVCSWRNDDGFVRAERPEQEKDNESSRKERKRRPFHAFECIVEQILRR